MPDEIDDLNASLRRAMAALDRQVPSDYFDTLPERTLARLDDPAIGDPGELHDPGDDSDLRSIRDLAGETRARLSRRGVHGSRSPDDAVAASSASWKAIALPDPGKLPASLEPPGAGAHEAAAMAAIASMSERDTQATGSITTLASGKRASRGRRTTVAIAGLGVAAAASLVTVLTVRDGKRSADSAMREPQVDVSSAPAGTKVELRTGTTDRGRVIDGIIDRNVEHERAAAPSGTASPDSMQRLGEQAPQAPSVANHGSAADDLARSEANKLAVQLQGAAGKRPLTKAGAPGGKPQDTDTAGSATQGSGDTSGGGSVSRGKPAPKGAGPASEPSLDELLGESDQQPPRPTKTKLGRTSPSADDIRRGMTAVESNAKACYAGTQGVASLRLTIAPSGRVARVAVTGPFAGTPVGACVERAVAAATFPPWDGGPQTFGYSYLLSD